MFSWMQTSVDHLCPSIPSAKISSRESSMHIQTGRFFLNLHHLANSSAVVLRSAGLQSGEPHAMW